MVEDSIILKTDSYKVSHYRQYPPDATKVFSYYESRGGLYPETLFFGLQYILKRHLVGEVVTSHKIQEAEGLLAQHFGDPGLANLQGWRRIVEHHNGRLPVEIRAVPEGTVVPNHNVLMTIVNTDRELPWLTNYLETLLCQVWYPSTVATLSRVNKRTILRYLEETGDSAGIDFKLHDFGYRGSTSDESAGIGGLAHLVNFRGTDTIAALVTARHYYGEPMAGHSIPAAEHSTITSWGQDREAAAYRNMLRQFPSGLVAVVSDSYDIYAACGDIWGEELRQEVLDRDGVLVIRPDSGDPPTVIARMLDILWGRFGGTTNLKGYKVLHSKVRIIQGDGIDPAMINLILGSMKAGGWSADNIAFGSGGGLLQKMDRDTQQFAFKCSAIEITSGGDAHWRPVMKRPVTDDGKASKGGQLKLVRVGEDFQTCQYAELRHLNNELVPVFRNGELLEDWTLDEVRER